MTRLTTTEVECPKCKQNFKILCEASINTWLDPDLIQKVVDDAYNYKCPSCNENIHLITKILINCPKGMFWISNNEDLDTKMKIFREYNIIDENGNIARPNMVDNPPNRDLGPSFQTVLDVVRNFKDEILKDIEDQDEANEKFHRSMEDRLKNNEDKNGKSVD